MGGGWGGGCEVAGPYRRSVHLAQIRTNPLSGNRGGGEHRALGEGGASRLNWQGIKYSKQISGKEVKMWMLKICKHMIVFLCALSVHVALAENLGPEDFECYVVPRARLYFSFNPNWKYVKPWDFELVAANWGHEIEPSLSNLSVIGVRRYAENSGALDSQNFDKITIEMSDDVGSVRGGKVRPSRSFYTSGSVGFVGKGAFARGQDVISDVALADGKSITIKIGDPSVVAALKVASISCSIKVIEVHDLNFWQGRIGGGWPAFNPHSSRNE